MGIRDYDKFTDKKHSLKRIYVHRMTWTDRTVFNLNFPSLDLTYLVTKAIGLAQQHFLYHGVAGMSLRSSLTLAL